MTGVGEGGDRGGGTRTEPGDPGCKGTGAVGSPPRGVGGQPSERLGMEKRERSREAQTAGRGVGRGRPASDPRHPEAAAPSVLADFHFITFWSVNSGAGQQHILCPSQPPISEEINGPTLFVGTRPPTPNSPANQVPPPYFGKTTSNPPPIPHLGTRLAAFPVDWNQTRTPPSNIPRTSSDQPPPPIRRRGGPHFWKRPRALLHLKTRTRRLPLFGLQLLAAALVRDLSPLLILG